MLKAPDIPSILVETAFISNPEEEARLNDEACPGPDGGGHRARPAALLRAQPADGQVQAGAAQLSRRRAAGSADADLADLLDVGEAGHDLLDAILAQGAHALVEGRRQQSWRPGPAPG